MEDILKFYQGLIMQKKIKCPICKNEEAIIHPTYGVVQGKKCNQQTDNNISTKRKFEFANISKSNRIQKQRDDFAQDMEQPYKGNKPNKAFFQLYPDKVDDYGVAKELEKI